MDVEEILLKVAAVVGVASVVVRSCAYASDRFSEYAETTENTTDDLWAKRFARAVGYASRLLSAAEKLAGFAALQLPRKKNAPESHKPGTSN